ncbi:MAG: glycosyltransferase family 2 protein [Armatimonadota bacterium]
MTADAAVERDQAASREHADPGSLTATVLVPSYNRPETLLNCLNGIIAGSRLPEQLVVVLRESDERSHESVAGWLAEDARRDRLVDVAQVRRPGPMAAAEAGLKLATSDVVCLIDDDCVPTEEWLERILTHYAEPDVIGVGGRDRVHHGERIACEPAERVGRITWYARIIGNHHQPDFDEVREVDHLKGANMSFRREIIPAYDLRLRSGVFHEIDVAFGALQHDGRLLYDPLAIVDHYPAPRHFGHPRDSDSLQAVTDLSHDYAYVMLKHLPPARRVAFWLFALLVGQHWRYGALRMLAALPREGRTAVMRWRAALRGLAEARGTLHRAQRGAGGEE